ncbi:hypothetical protein [Pseudomonas putida]|nr:hypothetical protein [Pseudomonas putida]
MLAMVVNDNAGYLGKRGVLESIASMLAPTGDWLFTHISCSAKNNAA